MTSIMTGIMESYVKILVECLRIRAHPLSPACSITKQILVVKAVG